MTANFSAYSNVLTASITPTSTGGIKWHPGHYAWIGTDKFQGNVLNNILAEIDGIAGDPTVAGILLGIYWGDLEGKNAAGTVVGAGEYGFGFVQLDAILARCQLRGKRFQLRIYERYFGGTLPENVNNGYFIPAYLNSSTYGSGPYGGVHVNSGGTGLTLVAKTWNPALTVRFNALIAAIGNRYNSHPFFELLTFEETSLNFGTGGVSTSDWTAAKHVTSLQSIGPAMRAAWPNTGLRLQLNYFGPSNPSTTEIANLVRDYYVAYAIGLGGPDTTPTSTGEGGLDYGDYVYLGRPAYGGVNYAGVIPMTAESQDYTLSHDSWTMQQIYDGGIARTSEYFVWYKNSFSVKQWATDVLPFIRSINGAVATTVAPSSYAAYGGANTG